eukprot:TRINITY_DN6662_c0_g1_i1.p2 TRINITY_DN6662_c0_g1~~TRINITY_DN6662_c0_g1_i1.p2  ORF type:complete len:179 (-),score=57.15 TRINITY_DN6662_c0_g1_i1:1148-1651(-)
MGGVDIYKEREDLQLKMISNKDHIQIYNLISPRMENTSQSGNYSMPKKQSTQTSMNLQTKSKEQSNQSMNNQNTKSSSHYHASLPTSQQFIPSPERTEKSVTNSLSVSPPERIKDPKKEKDNSIFQKDGKSKKFWNIISHKKKKGTTSIGVAKLEGYISKKNEKQPC